MAIKKLAVAVVAVMLAGCTQSMSGGDAAMSKDRTMMDGKDARPMGTSMDKPMEMK